MNKLIRPLGILMLAVALAGGITTVSADQISQTQNFSGIPNFSSILTFNKFTSDPQYTLNWISVSLTLNVDGGRLTLDNDANSPASGTFEFGGKAFVSGSSVPMLNLLFQPVVGTVEAVYSQAFSLAPNQDDGPNDWSPLPPDGLLYLGGPQTDTNSGFIAPILHSNYIGAGTFNVTIQTNQWQSYGAVSGIEMAVTPVSANGSMTIVYDYTPPAPVPEPATMVMSLVGLAGTLGGRRLFGRRT